MTAVGLADSELVAYRFTRTGGGDFGKTGRAGELAPLLAFLAGPDGRLVSTESLGPGATAALRGGAGIVGGVGSGGGALLCSPSGRGAGGALAVPHPLPHDDLGTGKTVGGDSGGSSTIGVTTGIMGLGGTAVMGITAGPPIIIG